MGAVLPTVAPSQEKPKGVCLNRAALTPCKWPRCDCRVGLVYTTAYKTAGIPRR